MGTNDRIESREWITEARNRAPWLVLTSLLTATCVVDGPTALTIDQNQVPEISGEGACLIPSERSMVKKVAGTYDIAMDRSYAYNVYPLVVNRLPEIAHENEPEPNRIDVTAMRVRIEAPPGVNIPWTDSCPEEFDYAPAALPLMPGEEGATVVQALRPCHADLFRDMFRLGHLSTSLSEHIRFRVILQAKGRHGSSQILSAPFEFPVRICYGCLQTGFPGPFSLFNFPNVPLCDQVGEHDFVGNTCNPGQDLGPILCCAKDPDRKSLVCPAPSVKKPATP